MPGLMYSCSHGPRWRIGICCVSLRSALPSALCSVSLGFCVRYRSSWSANARICESDSSSIVLRVKRSMSSSMRMGLSRPVMNWSRSMPRFALYGTIVVLAVWLLVCTGGGSYD